MCVHGVGQTISRSCSGGHAGCIRGGNLSDPANARSDTLDVLKYTIDLDMTQMSSQQISASCTIDIKSKMDGIDHVNLDLLDLQVDSVTWENGNLAFIQENPILRCDFPQVLNMEDVFQLSVHYHGHPALDGSWGGFYFSSGYAYNLGVGFDADPHNFGRVWFPCFDNFVEKSRYEFHVLTNNSKTSYCNGLRLSTDTVGIDSLLTTWILEEEIPSYLASVSVGDYVHSEQPFENILGETIPVWLVAKPVDTLDMKESMIHLVPWLHGLEMSYGLHRFPRVGFCAVPFNGGAMEHATNISYPLFAIDGTTAYETLYAHEIAHHWWGDNVTCRTEEDMWINEGWASYSEALFMEKIYGVEAYMNYVRANHKDVMAHAHISDGARYPVSPVPHEITYGAHVYNKGADVAHTLRAYMGNDFFVGIQALMEEYQFADISSEDMRDFLQAYTDADLSSYFDNWVFQPGFPEFRISEYNEVTGALTIEQHKHYAPEFYTDVPMMITALGEGNQRMDTTVLVSGASSSFQVTTGFQPWAIYLNDSSKISQAVLGESQVIDHTGTNDFDYAEMDIFIGELLEGDSFRMRIENHWATANDPAFIPGTDVFISPDRWWSVIIEPGYDSLPEADIIYRGNSGSSNYFDPLFFEYLENNGYTENDMVLMYRAPFGNEWSEYSGDYSLNTQGGNSNWTGKITIASLVSGDYAWAVHTGNIGLGELSDPVPVSAHYDGSNILTVKVTGTAVIEIRDQQGKLLLKQEVRDVQRVHCGKWAPGMYHLLWSRGAEKGDIKWIKPTR